MSKKLIGKRADITDKQSVYYGHWGYIKDFDGDVYYIDGGSISLDSDSKLTPIFDRDQFVIRRNKNNMK